MRSRAEAGFSEQQRFAILKLFKQYEKTRALRRDWDLGDWVFHIHRRVGSVHDTPCSPGVQKKWFFPDAAKFQEIYIDEVCARVLVGNTC